jgi:N-acetylglucosamine-6-sulfatase
LGELKVADSSRQVGPTRILGGASIIAGLTVVAMLAGAGLGGVAGSVAAKPQARPNVIVVVTDDLPMSFLAADALPHTLELLGAQGTTFTDAVVTTPLCCPSRAAYLTGQYGHNNGVLSNRPGYSDLLLKGSVLPAWLRRAGYATFHVGRYLNGYKQVSGARPAPGWKRWFTVLEPRNYYGYQLAIERKTVRAGFKREDYLTRVLNRRAVSVIRQHAPGQRPFYLQLDHLAPHDETRHSDGPCGASAIPTPGALAKFAGAPLPMPVSFDEADVSDKPSFIQQLQLFDESGFADLEREYRCRMASLVEVDRGIQKIVDALAAKGELDETMIAFTSDNGFYVGEHRARQAKYLPYEEGIHVPLLVRFPASVGALPVVSEPVANIDLTATVLEIAGATPCLASGCRVIDGRSVLHLAAGNDPGWPADRGIGIELDRRFGTGDRTLPCAYHGVRTSTHLLVEYTSVPDPGSLVCEDSTEAELYDLVSDPFELENLYPTRPGTAARAAEDELAERLTRLSDCAGISGRDPEPASGHYCE